MTSVAKSLWKTYRPVMFWFWGIITAVSVLATAIVATVTDVQFSFWVLIAGQASKWWLLVLGTLLVAVHLKLFIANGLTRRAFLLGSGLFGLLGAVAFAALVPIGHGVERLVWTAFGTPPADYPDLSMALALREFGHFLPGGLACLVTGVAVAAGFYRYPWWAGLLLVVPGAVPLLAAEGLLGLYEAPTVPVTRLLPFAGALAVSLVLTALGALMARQVLHDVAIRRPTG